MKSEIDAFIKSFRSGKMSAYDKILTDIKAGKTLADIVDYIENNEQYKEWCDL